MLLPRSSFGLFEEAEQTISKIKSPAIWRGFMFLLSYYFFFFFAAFFLGAFFFAAIWYFTSVLFSFPLLLTF